MCALTSTYVLGFFPFLFSSANVEKCCGRKFCSDNVMHDSERGKRDKFLRGNEKTEGGDTGMNYLLSVVKTSFTVKFMGAQV